MPSSKDLLTEAKKTLDDNSDTEANVKIQIKTCQDDLGNYATHKRLLQTAIISLSNSADDQVDRLKALNKGLSDLKKTEPVMKAPADAKVYEALVKAYTKAIQDHMGYHKDMEAEVTRAKSHL